MIQILDSKTIDKIAAGEVVEKPASVVKELVENSIDAKATMITVEIKEGGISFIRVTDNGTGIHKNEVQTAFLRHATSKIASDDDLNYIHTLGFRGEALASICAVSQMEMITKTKDSDTGVRICVEGGNIKEFEDVGAPDGTTVIVRNIFYNTPARKKFLRQPATEGAHIEELMEHVALCEPNISFKVVINGKLKFNTTGKGDLKEVIYRIYGRDIAKSLIPISVDRDGFVIDGYIGKPEIVRSNRNFENYFVNRRYVKSVIIANGIEEGYKSYLMQHKFPFCVLHIDVDTENIDVNVHPTKMEVRISNSIALNGLLIESIKNSLSGKELIPDIKEPEKKETIPAKAVPEPFETKRISGINSENSFLPKEDTSKISQILTPGKRTFVSDVFFTEDDEEASENTKDINDSKDTNNINDIKKSLENTKEELKSILEIDSNSDIKPESENSIFNANNSADSNGIYQEQNKEINPESDKIENAEETEVKLIPTEVHQKDLFEEKVLNVSLKDRIKLIGQIFDTYWLFTMDENLYCMDQHAAHEKVKYEEFMENLRNKQVFAQQLLIPALINLKPTEFLLFKDYSDVFADMGFEIDEFGENTLALRAIPQDLYNTSPEEMFLDILEELSKSSRNLSFTVISEKIATKACKAAVKGNNSMTFKEADELINKLMTLKNPYNCPHGRPTIISMSKYEIEKKFKRIV